MKSSLYLETTIPGYLTSRPSRDLIVAGHQQVTREWWETRRDTFQLYISQLVIDEVSAGDPAAAGERRTQRTPEHLPRSVASMLMSARSFAHLKSSWENEVWLATPLSMKSGASASNLPPGMASILRLFLWRRRGDKPGLLTKWYRLRQRRDSALDRTALRIPYCTR